MQSSWRVSGVSGASLCHILKVFSSVFQSFVLKRLKSLESCSLFAELGHSVVFKDKVRLNTNRFLCEAELHI